MLLSLAFNNDLLAVMLLGNSAHFFTNVKCRQTDPKQQSVFKVKNQNLCQPCLHAVSALEKWSPWWTLVQML